MEKCLLCLELNTNLVDSIPVNSAHWKELNISILIEKHFWPMKTMQLFSWLCKNCWKELSDFHKFYIQIEEAHAKFETIIKDEIPNDTLQNNCSNNETQSKDLKGFNEFPFDVLEIEGNSDVKEEVNADGELYEDNMPLMQRYKANKEDPLNESKKSIQTKTTNSKTKKIKISARNSNSFSKSSNNHQQITEEECQLKQDPELMKISRKDTILPDLQSNDDYDSNVSDSDSNNQKYEKSLPLIKTKLTRKCNSRTLKSNLHEQNEFLAENFKFSCNLCQLPFESFKDLRKHFHAQHNEPCYVMCCNKRFLRSGTLFEHLKHHLNPNEFACQQCDKVLSTAACLKLHIKKMHEAKPEKSLFCDICQKGFANNFGLRTHKLIHLSEEEKTFPCSECGKRFGTNSQRSGHIRAVHLKKHILICTICGKSIREKEALERHMLEHEGKEAPTISCELCGLRVVNKDCLKRHKAIKHPADGGQEHICPICSKVSPNIKAHRSHVSYNHKMTFKHKCTICERAFKKPQELKEHMASHTGDILYTCPWCPKTFNSRSYMHNHRKNGHPLEWEEETRKKYSGNLPPNLKQTTITSKTGKIKQQ